MTTPHPIICAVRGHPTSRATITSAIDRALETGAPLIFFHVLTVDFLEYATIGVPRVVYTQMREMSEFMLLLLCDRARRRGVQQVEYVIREGSVQKQLHAFVIEREAGVLVMGKPAPGPGRNVFAPAALQAFIANLQVTAPTITIVQVDPDEESE